MTGPDQRRSLAVTAGQELVVLGASGHARVIVDILQNLSKWKIVACIGLAAGSDILGVPVTGSDDLLPTLFAAGVQHAFIAVGDNRRRASLVAQTGPIGFSFPNAVSKHAIVSRHVTLGRGVAIMPGAVINAGAEIGDFSIINTGATVDHDCQIGESAHIGPGVSLCGNVHVGPGALIGVGARVIPGCQVGAWTVVGAGAVVIRDIPPDAVYAGVPARDIRKA